MHPNSMALSMTITVQHSSSIHLYVNGYLSSLPGQAQVVSNDTGNHLFELTKVVMIQVDRHVQDQGHKSVRRERYDLQYHDNQASH
jgi:hypothetical protein